MGRCIYVRVGQVYAWAGLVSVAGPEGVVVSWGAGSSCRVVRMHGHRGYAHMVGHPVGPDERWIVAGSAGWRRWRRRGRACAQTDPSHTVRTVKRGIARPCATGEDLVRVGQSVRILPRVERGLTEGGMLAGRRESVGRRWRKQCARRTQLRGVCWQGTRGAHVKHVPHGRDAGDVEAQRLVERRRALPSRKGSMGRGAYCGATGHARSALQTCWPWL